MDWQTTATVIPTAVSAAIYTLVQSSFLTSLALHKTAPQPAVRPWVSILKPLAGADEELRENLESFARIDYPAYEIVFGVASLDDPAVPIALRFIAEHPSLPARLVKTTPARGAVLNPKVAQLLDLTRAARGSVIVVSDANVRVPVTYLRSLIDALLRPGVGIVSSRIVGRGERSLGAALENAQLGAQIGPAVVAAHKLFGRPVTVGKSMAMRRADLARVGGWESVEDVLAEDDVLGRRFHDLGYGVELVLDPIEDRNVACAPRRSIERHTRWAKMRRAIAPRFFLLEPLLSPIFVSLAAATIAPSAIAAKALCFATLLQVLFAFLAHSANGATRPLLLAAMEPVRALASIACHLLALASRRVSWRGNPLLVGPGSKLSPIREGASVSAPDGNAVLG
jgi:ceramide glucosyltransferase